MTRGFVVVSSVLGLAAGVGAASIASAQSGHGTVSGITIVGSNFGPTLASSSELQIKDGKAVITLMLAKKGYDYWQTQSNLSARVSVTVPLGNGLPDEVLSSAFTLKAGQTKVTLPTTLAQRHAINVKGTGAQTGRSKPTASIEIAVDKSGSDGAVNVYRYTKSGHITVLKRAAAVSLAPADLVLDCSLSSCPNPFGDGSIVRVPLVCAGNPDDNETCKGTVTVTVKPTSKTSIVWSGSYTVPPSPDSEPVAMAIKVKGTGADNNLYAATIKVTPTSGSGKKEFSGHVTLLK